MDRRDFLRISGGAIAAGAVAGTSDLAADAQSATPFAAPAIPMHM
jgi:hypothetical protein